MFNNAQLPPADCYGTLLVCPNDKINHKESSFPYNNNTLFHQGSMSNPVP